MFENDLAKELESIFTEIINKNKKKNYYWKHIKTPQNDHARVQQYRDTNSRKKNPRKTRTHI